MVASKCYQPIFGLSSIRLVRGRNLANIFYSPCVYLLLFTIMTAYDRPRYDVGRRRIDI